LIARPGFVARPRGTLFCCATAREPRHLRQSAPNTAEGLTAVFRALRTDPATGGRRADLLLTSETGEPFWTEELAMAYLRNVALMPEPFTRTTAAEGLGDLGAAAARRGRRGTAARSGTRASSRNRRGAATCGRPCG